MGRPKGTGSNWSNTTLMTAPTCERARRSLRTGRNSRRSTSPSMEVPGDLRAHFRQGRGWCGIAVVPVKAVIGRRGMRRSCGVAVRQRLWPGAGLRPEEQEERIASAVPWRSRNGRGHHAQTEQDNRGAAAEDRPDAAGGSRTPPPRRLVLISHPGPSRSRPEGCRCGSLSVSTQRCPGFCSSRTGRSSSSRSRSASRRYRCRPRTRR